jgi:hypothetical protein
MVLGAVPASSGSPAVAPIELPPLLAKLDVEAVANADIPPPSAAWPCASAWSLSRPCGWSPCPASTRPASTRLDTGPLLRLVGGALMLLALAAGAGAVTARADQNDRRISPGEPCAAGRTAC